MNRNIWVVCTWLSLNLSKKGTLLATVTAEFDCDTTNTSFEKSDIYTIMSTNEIMRKRNIRSTDGKYIGFMSKLRLSRA